MTGPFHKFPSTPHLALLGDLEVRDDKVMSESQRSDFLRHELVVEEKVDGANLGISFDAEGNIHAQNRGGYLQLPSSDQWRKLPEWLSSKADVLFDHLSDNYILFGEWCFAEHSVAYDRLPDWFLGFDIYDKKTDHFFSSDLRDQLFQATGISQVPRISRGRFTMDELGNFLSKSRFGESPAEGLYLRIDRGKCLVQRAKLVRPAFIRSVNQHWSRCSIKPNRLAPVFQRFSHHSPPGRAGA